jgi:hypothetical protein
MYTVKTFLWLWLFIVAFVSLSINNVSAQSGDLDGTLSALRNNDLRFEAVCISPSPSQTYDTVKHVIYVSMLQLRIKSINVEALQAKYRAPNLVRRLVFLLDDSSRDWYANLLLYQISGLPNAGALAIQSREAWLLPAQKGSPTTFRDQDIAKWKKYELELSNPSNK